MDNAAPRVYMHPNSRMKHLVSLLALSFWLQVHAADPQVILLKLDDVVAHRVGTKPVWDRWLRVHDYLKASNIKASFGIITESLEKDNAMYFQWLKDVQAMGLIEFWMHGYYMKKADEPGEFEHGTAAEQQVILEKGARLAKEKLGFELPAFGPHWSGTTDATDEALEAVSSVKIWLYGPKKPKFFTRLSIERIMAIENPTFVPDPAKFKALYEKSAATHRPCSCCRGIPINGMTNGGQVLSRSLTF